MRTRHRTGQRRVALEAPAAAQGSGQFKRQGPTGITAAAAGSHDARSNPAARLASARQASSSGTLAADPQAAILSALADLYIGSDGKKGFEGCIDYLYADSEGHVTVGVGHLVAKKTASDPEVRAALAAIPLVHTAASMQSCSGSAHELHKLEAYRQVRARYEGKFAQVTGQGLHGAYQASIYDPMSADSPGTARAILGSSGNDPTSGRNKLAAGSYSRERISNLPETPMNADLRLSPGAARDILKQDLERKLREAKGVFPDLTSLSTQVQLVVLDVLFNGTGIGGKGGWGRFKTAIHDQQWTVAASCCAARIDPTRDAWRREQLLAEAARERLER